MAIGDWLVKRIKDLARTATSSDLTDGEFVAVDKTDGYTRKMTVAGLATWVLGKIKSLATTITTFRDGDVIPVDGSQGTAKMTAVSLASWIHGRWAAFVNALTAKTSFANGDKIPVVNGNTASAMAADDLLHTTSQNALAGNVAPLFDPNKPNDAGGYAYYTGNNVTYEGQNFVFIANHKAGTWNPLEVEHKPLSESINLQGVGEAVDEWLNNHPEATTTVPDGSLTKEKFSALLQQECLNDYVTPEMFGAIGDGTTDDTAAVQSCLDYAFVNRKSTYLSKSYKITASLDVHDWCVVRGNGKQKNNDFNIIFNPSQTSSLENPGVLFVCNDQTVGKYHHTFINVTIRKLSGVCTCFGASCPIDQGSVFSGCHVHAFNTVFDCYIGHISWIVNNHFTSIMYAFHTGNMVDAYVVRNYISAYRPFAPYCFYGGAIYHSTIAENFFDFWFGVFLSINDSLVRGNIFDYCFMVFGYADQYGVDATVGRIKLSGSNITNNIFPSCASCHTSNAGFGNVKSTIALSPQGSFKVELLENWFPCAISAAGFIKRESDGKIIPTSYYYVINGVISNNTFGADGILLTGILGGLRMEGNSYNVRTTSYFEELDKYYVNAVGHSNQQVFEKHLPVKIDLFELVQFRSIPRAYPIRHDTYGSIYLVVDSCTIYHDNKPYVCRWDSSKNEYVFYDAMGNPAS